MAKRSLKNPPPEEQPFPLAGYVLINGLFYIFCLLIYWTARYFQRGDVAGLIPILLGLAICFFLVTVYDAVFDRVLLRQRWRELTEMRRREMESQAAETGTSPGVSESTAGTRTPTRR